MRKINRRTFLKMGIAAGVGLAIPAAVLAQTPPPPPAGGKDQPKILQRKVTPADRLKAAQNVKKLGLKPGAAAGPMPVLYDSQGKYIPHYFGPFPNYANSPMPKGEIVDLTVDEGGSGYTNPVVVIDDVYGTGSGATATATMSGGVITGITITNPGSGYSAPLVTIEDPTGDGALISATIGNLEPGSGIRKFVDSVAGLDPNQLNTLNQFIPVAVPDTTSFPGDDYYVIEVGEYTQKLHSDLPPTKIRGYRQVNAPGGASNPINQFHYLGPTILARRNRAVRILFVNNVPSGSAGKLFIPVDESVMGAGLGPIPDKKYPQSRAVIHLHGGLTPWISDGTPYQWIVPAGDFNDPNNPYKQGESMVNVPDMWFEPDGTLIPGASQTKPGGHPNATNDPGPGKMTYYYVNAQSARMMFYHDHVHGLTRLNVYVGEAAGYLLTDELEDDLIDGTNTTGVNPDLLKVLPGSGMGLHKYGIPLVIQDKTFVDGATIQYQDPNWIYSGLGTTPGTGHTGDFWMSSVYMPAQNPYDPSGASAFGRWMYGPWFWPPTSNITNPPVVNEYYDPVNAPWEPPKRPDLPNPSMGMEAFNDTSMVNGVCYPYMDVEPTVYRFRILSVANDRVYNLSLFVADPDVVSEDGRRNTEVKMVPALSTPGFPANWPTDGRVGGVPDPDTAGPSWIQIGTEGGFLPQPVVIPPQPITWNLNQTSFNFGNIEFHSLLLAPAERADVLVDFSQFAGKTLILYNDAPAAFPALDPHYDYFTGNPNQLDAGGTPSTLPGFGPNTRTVMQFRVGAGAPGGKPLSSISVTNGGSGYLTAPLVEITGGGGNGAQATATCGVGAINVTHPGNGYNQPVVEITGGGGTGAKAVATVSNGRIVSIKVTDPGSGYTSAPTVSIYNGNHRIYIPLLVNDQAGTGTDEQAVATAVATLTVNDIQLTNPGSGYTSVPMVTLFSGGGHGASALASLPPGTSYNTANLVDVWKKTATKPGVFEKFQDPIIVPQAEYNSAYNANFPSDYRAYVQQQDFEKELFGGPLLPNNELFSLTLTKGGTLYPDGPVTVSITGGGGSGATAEAWAENGKVVSVTLTNGGTGYTSQPAITFTGAGGNGSGAEAVANIIPIGAKAIQDEMGEAYDTEYGRMSGFLGVELPKTAAGQQKFALYPYSTPPVDLVKNTTTQLLSVSDGVQIWKITHNGVDTHPIHVHLFNAQLVNRVAWDGAMIPPEPNELGWKETIRVNPLEHTVIALRPVAPNFPFKVPNSVRLIDPVQPAGVELMGGPGGFVDPTSQAAPVYNELVNFGWEYVWHCHILSHEEMDMMHPLCFGMAPEAPTNLTVIASSPPPQVVLNWQDNSVTETHFAIHRRLKVPGAPWVDLSHKVVKLPLTNKGTGYTTATVTISGGNGTGATATAVIDVDTSIKELVITNPGSGYMYPPTVTITGDGNGATATAELGIVPANVTTFTDTYVVLGQTYEYRIVARNTLGYTRPYPAPAVGYPRLDVDSEPSNIQEASLV